MSNAATRPNPLTLIDNRGTRIEVRFGHYATISNRAEKTREILNNPAAEKRVAEMLAAGWVTA